jgi:hypothetical protein
MLTNLVSVCSATAYVGAYAAIAIYSWLVREHRDLWPFYAMLTLFVAIHATIVTIHTWRRSE